MGDLDLGLKITEADLPVAFTVKLLGRRDARGLWGIKNTREPVDNMIAVAKELNLSLPVVHLRVSKEGVTISPFPYKETAVKIRDEPRLAQRVNVPKVLLSKIKHSVVGFKSKTTQAASQSHDLRHIENEHENATSLKPSPNNKPLLTDLKLLEKMKVDCQNGVGETFLGIDVISYGVQDLIFTRVFSMIVVSDEPGRSLFHCYGFICEDRNVARSITYALSSAFQVYSRTLKGNRNAPQQKKERGRLPKILGIELVTPQHHLECVDSQA